jgi:hypothetical protein
MTSYQTSVIYVLIALGCLAFLITMFAGAGYVQ